VRHLRACDADSADWVLRRARWLVQDGLANEAAELVAAAEAMSREQPFAPGRVMAKAPLARFGAAEAWAGALQCAWYGGSPWLALQWEAALMRAEAEKAARVKTFAKVPRGPFYDPYFFG
jgi:hypothetical protein